VKYYTGKFATCLTKYSQDNRLSAAIGREIVVGNTKPNAEEKN